MKKISVILLLLCLSLAFSGCELFGGQGDGFLISKTVKYNHCYKIANVPTDNTRSGSPLVKGQEDRPVYDNIIMELLDLTPDKLTPDYKADLTKRLDLLHYDYHWNDDNSLTIISEGEEMTFGKVTDWPTSPDWVENFPVPKGIAVKEVEINGYSARITVSMTLDEAKAYVADLKDAGFTNDIRESTIVGYTYHATNQDGCEVNVTYSSLIQLIEIATNNFEDEPDDVPEISYELPKTGLIEYLPAINFGKVGSVYDAGDSLSITISDVSESEGKSFVSKCKTKFGSYVLSDISSNGMVMYSGLNDSDMTCSVVFIEKTLTISISK